MAGAGGGRTLEQTPTWAVAVVCFVLVAISIIIEYIIHLIAKWLKSKHKNALYEALEKIKSELMLLGFKSLLLTVGQGPISDICISAKVGATWHPCTKYQEIKKYKDADIEVEHHRKLLVYGGARLVLAAAGTDKCAAKARP
ncbi:MLO-like protein 12 [Abeliophyllum distichum]|uniref:MLO-like protein 12 n=1 Tax=Abeliophyllum distichum TaxID=126358 RepID=A0ABD1RBC6_9LAMI